MVLENITSRYQITSPLKELPRSTSRNYKHGKNIFDPQNYYSANFQTYLNLGKQGTLQDHIRHVHARLKNKLFDFSQYSRIEQRTKKGHTHRLINAILMLKSSINQLQHLNNNNLKSLRKIMFYYKNVPELHKSILSSFPRKYPKICRSNCHELSLNNAFNMLQQSVKNKLT